MPPATAPDPHDPASIARFADGIGCGVVATVSPAGGPEAALVGLAALEDGTLIFNTPDAARKVDNLRTNDRVAVVVSAGDVSVQAEGSAIIATGAQRERYGSAYERRFPGSRAFADGFLVVAVHPSWVRVYDAGIRPAAVAEADW
ncbi:pyridoxamine 5'-phosphate oxidase family protein [Microbacterium sp. KUDC0406]|uniref:pyridoxamine 5'-phosphate oxidase family protein n=1 Tax=Microbacterium sp. KUDC0406 TaxID=2909588 RepID=UPI001F1C4141|nr:pyridoxamine 5'-phosphate oxidase family protein [Microbacterium sp. KUDC0406]UJP10407.1 pyridoxamine 5'-phosphate oxidase family protein [Microbacterium sp. KUDC0406]